MFGRITTAMSLKPPPTTPQQRDTAKLKGALILTSAFTAVEVVGGLWTGSLALVADAAHMLEGSHLPVDRCWLWPPSD